MTQSEQKQIDKAAQQTRGERLRGLAVIHRAGSSKTQREVEDLIYLIPRAGEEFSWVDGALVHDSEL